MTANPTRNLSESQGDFIKLVYLVLACNEEAVIQKTILNLQKAMLPDDMLIVVADNCDDATADIAKDTDAIVLVREDRSCPGKSAALIWMVDHHAELIGSYDYVVILDADSIVSENFSLALHRNMNKTNQALQCQLVPSEFEGSPISSLSALSEIIEQNVFQRLRSLLGLSVRLRGTGMVFKSDVLIKFVPKLQTNVEDIALSLLLVEGKVKIHALRSPVIYDPKPVDQNAGTRQRARWFRGQWSSLWVFKRTVLSLILRGPDGWSMFGSIYLKPRWLKIFILTLLGLVSFPHFVIASICFCLVALDLLAIIIGITLLPHPGHFLKSMLHLPAFFMMWIRGIVLSFKSKNWLRARETKAGDTQVESDRVQD